MTASVGGGHTKAPPGTSTYFTLSGGPSLAVPLAGTYFIRHGTNFSYTTGGPGREYFNVDVTDDGTAAGAMLVMGSAWTDVAGTANGDAEASAVAVSDGAIFSSTPTLTQIYKAQSNSTTVAARNRWLELIPKYI